jgi:hypothetical protein
LCTTPLSSRSDLPPLVVGTLRGQQSGHLLKVSRMTLPNVCVHFRVMFESHFATEGAFHPTRIPLNGSKRRRRALSGVSNFRALWGREF